MPFFNNLNSRKRTLSFRKKRKLTKKTIWFQFFISIIMFLTSFYVSIFLIDSRWLLGLKVYLNQFLYHIKSTFFSLYYALTNILIFLLICLLILFLFFLFISSIIRFLKIVVYFINKIYNKKSIQKNYN